MLLTLKIGRSSYVISEHDKFLDNGACIQLLTQKGPFKKYHYTTLVLNKSNIKDILKFNKKFYRHNYEKYCKVFSLIKN
jgi:hypothetical protein